MKTMREWDFWGWTGYAALLVAAIIVAADAALKGTPSMLEKLPDFFHSQLWAFLPAIFVVLGTIILILRAFDLIGNNNKITETTITALSFWSRAAKWNPKGLNVGRVVLGVEGIVNELAIEVSFTTFNATGLSINAAIVSGNIIYNGRALPLPQLMPGNIINTFQDYAVVTLRQPLLKSDSDQIVKELSEEKTVSFDLDSLDIIMVAKQKYKADKSIRLPIWNGITCNRVGLSYSRLAKVVGTATASSSASIR